MWYEQLLVCIDTNSFPSMSQVETLATAWGWPNGYGISTDQLPTLRVDICLRSP